MAIYLSSKVTKLKGCPVAFLCSVAVSLSGNLLLHLSHLYELCITNALCTSLVNIVSCAFEGRSLLRSDTWYFYIRFCDLEMQKLPENDGYYEDGIFMKMMRSNTGPLVCNQVRE